MKTKIIKWLLKLLLKIEIVEDKEHTHVYKGETITVGSKRITHDCPYRAKHSSHCLLGLDEKRV